MNLLLKKPIKKPFATNSKKIVIQVQQNPLVDNLSEVHLDNDKFEPRKVDLLF
jgi:hypothetical protein